MAYSGELEEIMKRKGIKVGDTVIAAGIQGILMPSPDVSFSDDYVIIKLDSGYNVGVRTKFISKSTTRPAEEARREYEQEVEQKHLSCKKKACELGLPQVSLLGAGGTIASKIDYRTGGVTASMSPEDIFCKVPEIQDFACFKTIKTLTDLMSENHGPEIWKLMAEETAKQLNSGASGVILTQGTDVMHYNSAALSFMLQNLSGPVVITGSQRSNDRGGTDATMNLICSTIAATTNIAEVGICMHGESSDTYCNFMRGTKVRKMHSSVRHAFRPINDYPLAKIFPDGKVIETNENIKRPGKGKVKVDTKFDPKVALVKVYPNADPNVLNYYVSKGVRGIVLEGTALGHVPTHRAKRPWTPVIKDLTESGIVVGVATQSLYGPVNENVYSNLRLLFYDSGAVGLKDMLPETAYIKMGWVLGHTKSKEKAEEMLLTNYANEFNECLQEDMFLY